MPKITFPFTFIGKTKLGKIFRPYAIVEIFSSKRNKWQPVEMVIDTGADYCLFPKRYAEIFGIDIQKDCEAEKTLGVGGTETVYQYKALPIRIGSWQKTVPIGFLRRDGIPPLLGRLGCIEIFRLIFEAKESILEFHE